MYVHKNVFIYLSIYISLISKSIFLSIFLSITYYSEIYIWPKSQLKELQSWENRARTRGIRDFVRKRNPQARSVAPSPLLTYIGKIFNHHKLKKNLTIYLPTYLLFLISIYHNLSLSVSKSLDKSINLSYNIYLLEGNAGEAELARPPVSAWWLTL